MAKGRAESDFRQQGWIDTLGLKQIFSIYSVTLSWASRNLMYYTSKRTPCEKSVQGDHVPAI